MKQYHRFTALCLFIASLCTYIPAALAQESFFSDIPHPYPVFDNLRLCRKLPAWNTLTKAARWTT
jgi:hypothetical protein